MKINTYLVNLAVIMIMIFGGIFVFRYVRTGDLLLDQLVGISVGVILLIASFVWRRNQKRVK